ncbi:MAG: glycosyltransferase family 4 protein [Gammaproteobacteria bacterium]
MHVLMLTSEFPPRIGGIASHVAELALALRAAGVRVTVVAPADPPARGPEPDVLRHSPLLRAQPFADWLLGRWCRRWLRANPCDLVHVHGLRPLRAALATELPVVFTNHTSGFLQTVAAGGRRLRRVGRVLARCGHVLAPSEELVDAARAAGYTGPATYVPNGVDATRFTPGEARARRAAWGIPENAVAVVIARRLVAKNGVIDAARALTRTLAHVHFVFVGDGPERGAIEAVARDAGCAARAHLVGAVPNTAMPEIYRAADLCLLPSLMEATSIAGLEAMATGRALVGTRVGGIPALIEDGVNGLLVPVRDPDAIAAAVNTLARDPARVRAMGDAARARVEAEFAWPRIAARTLAVYSGLLQETPR